jgi:glycosyltransferase involved in cell wall biosynthesis
LDQIKVLQIIDSLNVGGAEALAVNIANGLAKKGVESHLCATRKEGDLKMNINNNVQYLFLKRKKTLDLKALLKLRSYTKKHKITIIHAHSTSSFIGFCIKMMCWNIKLIWHNHTGAYVNLKGKKLQFLKLYSKYFDYIISVNKDLDNWSKKVLNHSKGSFVENFPIFIDQSNKTKLFGIENKRIIYLAGLRSEKDHLNLLNAFVSLKENFPEWTIHLIGNDYEDLYSESIKQYIQGENLSNKVFLYGVCSDVKNILEQSTIGVLSSKSEGLPLSLLEYGLANLPIVITDVGECANIVKNRKVIVASQRSDKFAEALKELIKNLELRKEISYNFNKEVLENYSEEMIIKKLIKIYSN